MELDDLKKQLEGLVATMETQVAEFRKLQAVKFEQIEETGKVVDEVQSKLEAMGKRLDEETARAIDMKERLDKYETAGKRLGEPDVKAAPGPFKSFGEQLVSIAKAGLGGGVDPRLLEVKAGTGLSEGVNADGGFLVQTDFSTELLRLTHQMGQIYQRTRKIGISTNANSIKIPGVNETSRADGSRMGGIQGYWLDEAGTKQASAPTFRTIQLNLKKCAALVYATDELLQDASALEGFIMAEAPQELMFMAEDAFIRGLGAASPLGILASGATIAVAKEVGQANTTIVTQNIMKMYSRMHPRSLPNAVWYINQDCYPSLFQMSLAVGTGGVPTFMPPGGISGAPYGSLYGRPVVPVEYCSTLGTLGDIIFADFSQYIVAEKGGVQSASSIHVQFLTDQTVFRFVWRLDGQPTWNAPLIPYQGAANTVSPFITLAARP